MRTLLAITALLLLLAPAGARADRYRKGLIVFEQRNCTRCHSVGWRAPAKVERKNNLDLTRIATVRSADEIKRWLAEPAKVKPDTACAHRPLSDEEMDSLVHFLRARSRPEPEKPKPLPQRKGENPVLSQPAPPAGQAVRK